jgi:hypothetical protein
VSATVTAPDAPPSLGAPAVATCGTADAPRDQPPAGSALGPVTAVAATLDAGTLRVRCDDGVEVVRPAAWLRAAGDGRDAIDVVLRPCRSALTVTWRDGRRGRYAVAGLRS